MVLLQAAAFEFHIFLDPAWRSQKGRFHAQHFLDSRSHEIRVGSQGGKLVRVFKQEKETVAEQAGGGFVTRHQDENSHADQLASREAVAFILGLQEQGDQIFARFAAAFFKNGKKVGLEFLGGGHRMMGEFLEREPAGPKVGDGLRPVLDLSGVGGRHPKEIGDHQHRQRKRKFFDEVEAVLFQYRVDEPVNESAGPRAQALDQLQAGEVYVGSLPSCACACWGEILTATSRMRKAVGAVVNGPHRDTPQVLAQNWPVFSRGAFAQDSSVRMAIADYRCPIEIEGTRIDPGDLVFGDRDGVVIVPREMETEVITKALEKARGEKLVRKEIENGMSSTEAFRKYGIL